jgi:hypothetical protein
MDPRNTRVEEMSLGQRRMEASSEGGQGSEWAVVPYMDGWTRLNQITVLRDVTPCYLVNGVWNKPATCIFRPEELLPTRRHFLQECTLDIHRP